MYVSLKCLLVSRICSHDRHCWFHALQQRVTCKVRYVNEFGKLTRLLQSKHYQSEPSEQLLCVTLLHKFTETDIKQAHLFYAILKVCSTF